MCDVLDEVENRGIAKGKAEGEDNRTNPSPSQSRALIRSRFLPQNRNRLLEQGTSEN